MLKHVTLSAVTVIGKEGSTWVDDGIVPKLWDDANAHFEEIAPLAKRNLQGQLVGIWGAMSDRTHTFAPWEDKYSKGLYLAGVACREEAEAPKGWSKWVLPASEYVVIPNTREESFHMGLDMMREEGLELVGAAQDFTDPITGQMYIYYPVRRL